jgi:dihydroflavonol-4-reductase
MIFVTGATGLIGSKIIHQLVQEGHAVKALVRNNADTSLLKTCLDRISLVEGDVLDVATVDKAMEGVEYIIHTAAVVSYAPSRFDEMRRINIEGTANMVNIALSKGIKKMVHISSIAALGRSKAQEAIDESSEWKETEYNTEYAETKYLSELEVWRGVEEGLRAVILNPSVVIGGGDWNKSSTKLLKYAYEEHSLYPVGSVNYVDVRDVANISVRMLFNDIASQRFIVSSEAVKYKDLFGQAAALFGKKAPYRPVKPWMAELAWRYEALKYTFTGREPLITKETAKLSRYHTVYNNQKLINTLGYRYFTLQETLMWTCGELVKS